MPHNHKRSPESEERRWQRRVQLWENQFTRVSFFDRVSRELTSLTPVVAQGLESEDPLVIVEPGTVLLDAYGTGELQRFAPTVKVKMD